MTNQIHFKNKLTNSGINIFSKMTGLANEYGAINLAQGFPEFDADKALIKMVSEAMKKHNNQYAPMPGVPELRMEIVELVKRKYSASYDWNQEITVVPGATVGLYLAISTFISDGDEVIILEPSYDCYAPAVSMQGGIPKYFQMDIHSESLVDWDALRKLVSINTKMIVINTPHNPSGRILTAQDMLELRKITDNTDILVLSDEVYEHIVFDGFEHQSVARYPELAKRSIIVSSFGKTYHCTGWKMGYVLAPDYLTATMRNVYQYMVFSCNTPVQMGIANFLQEKPQYIDELESFYEEKRNLFREALKDSRFKLLRCQGTYFQSVSYEGISDLDDVAFSEWMTKVKGIACIPTSVFYKKGLDEKVVRLCFAKKDKTLLKAAEILCQI